MKLKILSWNIWAGKYLPEIISFLQKEDVDVIGLQEATRDLNGENNTAQMIAEVLGYRWVFEPTMQWEDRQTKRTVDWGNAILSRYRITNSERHVLSEVESRTAVQADIVVEKTLLHTFSVHLLHTHQKETDIQSLQLDSLLDLVPKEKSIVMGDFNALPNSYPIQKIREVLRSTTSKDLPTWSVYEKGCHVCLPKEINQTLDYIFTTQDIQSNNFSVGDSKGSDHLPIKVEVIL